MWTKEFILWLGKFCKINCSVHLDKKNKSSQDLKQLGMLSLYSSLHWLLFKMSYSVYIHICAPPPQVKPVELSDFLQAKKSEGYCIVGVEQTANSHSLQNYHFPERTLLLLGYEHIKYNKLKLKKDHKCCFFPPSEQFLVHECVQTSVLHALVSLTHLKLWADAAAQCSSPAGPAPLFFLLLYLSGLAL